LRDSYEIYEIWHGKHVKDQGDTTPKA